VSGNEITIDTNVFEHLFNPQNNLDDHIDALLRHLVERRVALCADKGGRMFGEYQQQLSPFFRKSDEGQKVIWLRYFLILAERTEVTVDFGGALMVSIRKHIPFAESSDRIFVYVAIISDCVLVSNDLGHITDHRNNLRKCARKHGSDSTDFVDSFTAHSLMVRELRAD
jgi:hypothetical protein